MEKIVDDELKKAYKQLKYWGIAAKELSDSKIIERVELLKKAPRHSAIDELYSSKYIWGVTAANLRNYDLSNLPIDLLYRTSFSNKTKWPSQDKLPKGFHPDKIIEQAKAFKGLGVEKLHEQGVTGKGVTIVYIDKPFDTRHIEFDSKKIEYIVRGDGEFNFHGYAVAARLAGQNMGIAKDINMIYYACGGIGKYNDYFTDYVSYELKILKDIIKRVENNEQIAAIGVSASISYHIYMLKNDRLKKRFESTFNELKKRLDELGVPLIDSETFWDKGFSYCFKIDPKLPNDYVDNYFDRFSAMSNEEKMSVIDADKCIPLVYTLDSYKYENLIGSASWSIPQVVGLYALAKQIDKDLTFDEFVEITRKTLDPANIHGVRLINAPNLIKEVQHQKQVKAESTLTISPEN